MFKKSAISIFIYILLYSSLYAQNGLPNSTKSASDSIKKERSVGRKTYLLFGIGYHISSGIGTFYQEEQVNNVTVSKKNNAGSYGGGSTLAFGIGRFLSKNVAFEMNMSMLFGDYNTVNNKYSFNISNPSYYVNETVQYSSNTFRLNPCLILTTDHEKKVSLYSKIGFLFGFQNGIAQTGRTEAFFSNGGTGHGNYEWDYTGSNPLGYHISLGTRVKLDKKVDFFAELMLVNMSRVLNTANLVTSSVNDKSILDDMDVSDKSVVYVDQTYTPVPQDPDKPTEVPNYKVSYNSWGFNIGLLVYLK